MVKGVIVDEYAPALAHLYSLFEVKRIADYRQRPDRCFAFNMFGLEVFLQPVPHRQDGYRD